MLQVSSAGLAALTLVAAVALAQTETGQIAGSVKDQSRAAIPNAKVTAESIDTRFVRKATTSNGGVYAITNLPPGPYRISVEADGFSVARQVVDFPVGAHVAIAFTLQIGPVNTVVEARAKTSAAVNTETPTLGTWIDSKEVVDLPTITRDPYDLVLTAGNISESDPSVSAGTPRGVGVAINGLRAPSTSVMLDGVNNNDEFNAVIGQQVPLDSVQEFSVLTNGFTAEYGRASGGIVNVYTKSGTNSFHGTLYEFNRVSELASNSFENNANGIQRPVFDRNQYGFSVGGPIVKNKLFVFSNTEWIRVRSQATQTAFIATTQLLAASDSNTQAFFFAFGALRNGLLSLGTFSRNELRSEGFDPCAGAMAGGPCMSLSPAMPLFERVAYNVPSDSGGGLPQNTYLHVTRFDYVLNQKTQIYGRYALQSNNFFAGSNSSSPYAGFDTGQQQFNNSALLSLTRIFSSATVAQSKLSFDRLNNQQPLGANAPSPSLYFLGSAPTSILGTDVGLPGYLPFNPVPVIPLPFGGPQNSLQVQHDVSHVRGAHSFRFGGTYTYLQDNRTFGAYEEGVGTLGTTFGHGLDNFLRGQLFQFQGAIDPQGKYPCAAVQNAACTVQLPVSQPSFSRSNRYHDSGIYAEDSWKVARRVTLNLGLRWEYYSVQHNNNPNLDSNFYPAQSASPALAIRNGTVELAKNSPMGGLTGKDWNNFAPRLGAAWDVFGDGKTSLRGGYGIGYERNFGLVTFNVIQNPPNYAVLALTSGVDLPSIPITTNNSGPLGGASGSQALPAVSLRALDPNLRTAYAHFWSASLEREIFPNFLLAMEYSGSKGVDLYSITNINRVGAGNVYLGDACTPDPVPGNPGSCLSRLRTTQYSNINFRSNDGFSIYNALNVRADIKNAFHSEVILRAYYTWSHAIDNLSSTFSEDPNNLDFGVLDQFHPRLDRGNADFDQRHRVAISAIWDVPVHRFANHMNQAAGHFLKDWTVASIFIAHSGNPYTLFDCSKAFSVCPRAMFDGAVPSQGPADPPAAPGQPNRFDYLNLTQYRPDSNYVNPMVNISDFGPFPKNMTGRNAFRGPGSWNLDLALYKTTKLTERWSLQLRGEAFNVTNHANLDLIRSANDVSSMTFVPVERLGRRNFQLGAKLIF
jgi:outer membrane receptor protein involved in Fe transport